MELLLEPSDNPAAQVFKKAIFEQGIPVTVATLDDTCGNLIQIAQQA